VTNTTTTTSPSVTTSSSTFIDFLLAEFRCAGLRARIVANEIEAMATALSAGLISAETAVLHLHETGALALVPTSSAWGMQ
jgi:imidazolonepropionase-like amidohydrolase